MLSRTLRIPFSPFPFFPFYSRGPPTTLKNYAKKGIRVVGPLASVGGAWEPRNKWSITPSSYCNTNWTCRWFCRRVTTWSQWSSCWRTWCWQHGSFCNSELVFIVFIVHNASCCARTPPKNDFKKRGGKPRKKQGVLQQFSYKTQNHFYASWQQARNMARTRITRTTSLLLLF